MEDEIDASPTHSQKKRKIKLNCRSRKIKKPEGDIHSGNIIDSQSDVYKSFRCDGPDGSVDPTNSVSNCLTRRDILRNVQLLEAANKVPVSSQKVRTINRLNNNRRESRFGFLNVTEHATQQPSTSALPSEISYNPKSDSAMETQWDLTDTQFNRIDVVAGNYYDSVTANNNTDDRFSIVCDVTNTIQRDNEVLHDSVEVDAEISPNEYTDDDPTDTDQHSLKRCRSIVQSIFDEWPTSPVKKKRCGSPKYVFNRKLIKRTYRRRSHIKTILPPLKIESPGAVSISEFHSDDEKENIRGEICEKEEKGDTENENDDEVDLNKSIHVIGNIQSLSEYYSQSVIESKHDEVNQIFKDVLELKCRSSTKPSQSLIDQEDFPGFDLEKSLNLSERFDAFSIDSDDSTFANQREYYLLDDGNSRTYASAFQDELLHEKLPKESVRMKNSSCKSRSGANMLSEKVDDMFEDIEKEYKLEIGRTDKCLDNLPAELASKQNNLDHAFHGLDGRLYPTYMGFTTASGRSLLVPSALLLKKASTFQNLTVSEDDLRLTTNWIGETGLDPDMQVDFLKESSTKEAEASKRCSDVKSHPTYVGFSTARGRNLPVASALISNKTKVAENDWIGDAARDYDMQVDCPMEISSKAADSKRATGVSHPTFAGFTTARGRHLPVSSELISKKTNIFQNVSVTEDDLKSTANWIGATGRDSNIKGDCLRENLSKAAESDGTTGVIPHPTFAGFSTARGRQLPVSSALISKKTNIFQNVDVSEDDLRGTANWIGDMRRDSIIKDDGLRETSSKESTDLESHPTYAGFSTARGRHLPIPSALISKKTNIFQNVDVSEDDLRATVNWIGDTGRDSNVKDVCFKETSSKDTTALESHPTFAGFSTARGRHLPVSSALISKKTNIFQNVDITEDDLRATTNWIGDTGRESNVKDDSLVETSSKENTVLKSHPTYAGFSTARGRHLTVSSALISKKTNIFQNVQVTEDDLKGTASWIGDTGRDFNELGDCSKETSLKEVSTESRDFKPRSTYAGFTTGRGSHLPVSSALISKKTSIFDNVTVTDHDLKSTTNWIGDNERDFHVRVDNKRQDNLKMSPLHTTGHFRETTNSINHPHRESFMVSKRNSLSKKCERSPVNTFVRPSPLRKLSMVNSVRKLEIESKENVNAELIDSLHPNNNAKLTSINHSPISFISPNSTYLHTPTSSISHVAITPTNHPETISQEVRVLAEACMQDDEWDPTSITASSTPIIKTDTQRNRPKQTRLFEKFNDIAGEDYFESSVHLDPIKVRAPTDIISLRKIALETQLQSITQKNDIKPVPSTLYVKKLASSKLQWKDFVGNDRPINRHATHNISSETSTNVLQITAENATKFKFNAWDHYSDEFCRENVNGIYLKDDIVVIMDENCRIGLHEISNAFLSCPTVDPKLIHDKWIENHFKWILIKLAGMERSFPHLFGGKVVTLENLMLQLKYRYDREIDQAERPAIRKICEMDDISAKRMILFVATITRQNFACEVELTDGWYSLTSTFDSEMTRLVGKGQIKVGTKLVIQGAEVIGLDSGCHPLDVPGNVRLRIHANSTRRSRWDSKLGYCKHTEPFRISLSSVLSRGGNITKLRIYVLRVYPLVYIDLKSSDSHSEKVERRRSMQEERDHSLIAEKVYSQVCKEYEDEEKSVRRENRPNKVPKPSDVSTITDPATLCYLLDEDNDPTRIEYEMTESQKNMVLDYRYKLNCSKMEAIKAKVNEKLSSIEKNRKKFIPMLKLKVTDDLSFDKTAIVSVWKPSEDIFSMIEEGSIYEMTGTASRGNILNELQIYARKNAIFQKLNMDCAQLPKAYYRRHTCIAEIISTDEFVLNELDTTGFVVYVGDISTSFQPVYIADSQQNVVCICFWQDFRNYAYDDVVLPKRFLAIKNLQWRPNSNCKPIPCAYATENTMFTEYPKSSELLSAMTDLKEKFETINMDEFIESCMEKIKYHRLRFASTPLPSNSMSSSIQSPSSFLPRTPTDVTPRAPPTLSNQSRIELLSKYGDAMATPPLQIESLNINYKPPCFKD